MAIYIYNKQKKTLPIDFSLKNDRLQTFFVLKKELLYIISMIEAQHRLPTSTDLTNAF